MMHRGAPVDLDSDPQRAACSPSRARSDDISRRRPDLGGAGPVRQHCRATEASYYLQKGVGHYGVFNGSRFRDEIAPRIREFIRAIEAGAKPAKSKPNGAGRAEALEVLDQFYLSATDRARLPRNGAGAHSRFGHKAMIGSDHRVLVLDRLPPHFVERLGAHRPEEAPPLHSGDRQLRVVVGLSARLPRGSKTSRKLAEQIRGKCVTRSSATD